MFYWSFTSLVHFWPPQLLILVTPMFSTSILLSFAAFLRDDEEQWKSRKVRGRRP